MSESNLKIPIIIDFSEEVLNEFAEFIDWDNVSYKLISKVPKEIISAIPVVSQRRIFNKMIDVLDVEAIKDFLSKGVDPNITAPRHNESIICRLIVKSGQWYCPSISVKHVEIVKALLKNGADPELESKDDGNSAMLAIDDLSSGLNSKHITSIKTMMFEKTHKPFS